MEEVRACLCSWRNVKCSDANRLFVESWNISSRISILIVASCCFVSQSRLRIKKKVRAGSLLDYGLFASIKFLLTKKKEKQYFSLQHFVFPCYFFPLEASTWLVIGEKVKTSLCLPQ